MLSTWLNFGGILPESLFNEFCRKISNLFFHSWTFYLSYLRNVWSNCETKKEMSQRDATLSRVPSTLTSDLEFSRSNFISGKGVPFVMERNGWELIGCPDVKHPGSEFTGRCADWGTFDLDRDLEFLKSYCISGMGAPIVMGESDGSR